MRKNGVKSGTLVVTLVLNFDAKLCFHFHTLMLLLGYFVSQHFQKSTHLGVEFVNIGDLFEDIAELLVKKQNFFLKEFVLAGCWHLAHSCQKDVDVARSS